MMSQFLKLKQENGGHFNNREELAKLCIEISTDWKMIFYHKK